MSNISLPARAPTHTPPHPGRIVGQDCIESLALTIGEAAEALGVTCQTLDCLINERGGISPEMALRLAKAFGSTSQPHATSARPESTRPKTSPPSAGFGG